ncbi:MAG: hypothetical protein IIU80_03530 [Clostridia bacterium]|nr:hypothetical protein [Clostridia bacterium]
MYLASNKFTAYTDSSLVRRPKSKITVGGVTYTGETALMSFPKISHSAERMIGVFPAKTCEFELLNKDGSISLNGKEVTVYRGIEIDGETEWVPMGIFSATDDNITNELTKRTIRFKGTDRSSRFDTSFVNDFVNDIEYPCTVLNFVKYICERHGVELETTSFPFAKRILLSAPNADASVSDRELIARIAELGGCLAVISRDGKLQIKQPQETNKTVKKRYYRTVSQEPKFGEIAAVTLGHSTYTDDIIYPEGATDSAVNWRIEDNPFVDGAIANADGTASTRQNLISDVANNIIGRSVIPFSVTDFIDDYIYDLGDTVNVEKKDGTTFETVILNISSNSRIRSNIGAATQTQGATNYAIAGSTKQQMKKLALEVDHQAGLIRGIVEDADGMRTTIQALSDKIDLKFEDLTDPDHLDIEHVTSISAEGVKIYNGKIQIFDQANEMIFGTDENGSLGVTGNIKVKFKSANDSNTATLKISNEDYEDTDYATASIKVVNNSDTVFSNISMWEVDGVGTTSITSDNISLSNEDGDVTIALSDNGVEVIGNTTVYGDIETYGNIYSNGVFTTKADRFEGYQHIRNSSDVYGLLKPGIGKVTLSGSVTPTIALELQDASEAISCRLDFFSSDGEAYVVIQGRNSSGTSKRLELGATNLYWGGSIACASEEANKTNIESASTVLDKVCNAGIYSYNYIQTEQGLPESGDISLNGSLLETETKAHYGLVIGDGYNTPEEVISSDGKHIDLYSMIALAWKAIQELANKFDTEVKNDA